jgi:uncharacterized protein YndB with AHSA1/START domain
MSDEMSDEVSGQMSQVSVVVDISAAPARVWRALTEPGEVSQWDGAVPIAVPDGYPAAGHDARWQVRFGPLRVSLHDRVRVVEPGVRFASTIDVGFVHLLEEYRLTETSEGTRLVSDNQVSSRVPGLGPLARRLARSAVETSMTRLKAFCESA